MVVFLFNWMKLVMLLCLFEVHARRLQALKALTYAPSSSPEITQKLYEIVFGILDKVCPQIYLIVCSFLHLHWKNPALCTNIILHLDWKNPFLCTFSFSFLMILIASLKQPISYDFTFSLLMWVRLIWYIFSIYAVLSPIYFSPLFPDKSVQFIVPCCLFPSRKGVGGTVHCFVLEVIEMFDIFKLNTSKSDYTIFSCILLFTWRDTGMLRNSIWSNNLVSAGGVYIYFLLIANLKNWFVKIYYYYNRRWRTEFVQRKLFKILTF